MRFSAHFFFVALAIVRAAWLSWVPLGCRGRGLGKPSVLLFCGFPGVYVVIRGAVVVPRLRCFEFVSILWLTRTVAIVRQRRRTSNIGDESPECDARQTKEKLPLKHARRASPVQSTPIAAGNDTLLEHAALLVFSLFSSCLTLPQ